jgi:hypothetical protein
MTRPQSFALRQPRPSTTSAKAEVLPPLSFSAGRRDIGFQYRLHFWPT